MGLCPAWVDEPAHEFRGLTVQDLDIECVDSRRHWLDDTVSLFSQIAPVASSPTSSVTVR